MEDKQTEGCPDTDTRLPLGRVGSSVCHLEGIPKIIAKEGELALLSSKCMGS
jgi:hypothetical protein